MKLSIIFISNMISVAMGLMYKEFNLSKLILIAAIFVMAIGIIIALMKSKKEIEEGAA